MIKIYSDFSQYERKFRPQLIPILRPFWKETEQTLAEQIAMYGPFVQEIEIVDRVDKADICILPFTWHYYYSHKQLGQAQEFIAAARQENKPVITWHSGDYAAKLPDDSVYVFSANGYASRRTERQYALCPFFSDPLGELALQTPPWRKWQSTPTIGFCGQAADTLPQQFAKLARNLLKNIQSYLGLSYWQSHTIMPATRLRAKVLTILEQSPQVETRFIKRTQYRGGNEKPAAILREEFLNNILETDYTVCLRGTGNFSQRFYETLALGRIPIFVNTDCILPYDSQIDWPRYCVWIEQDDLSRLPEKVMAFHQNLDAAAFQDLQNACRQLWLERLSFAGFHAHFGEHFSSSR